MLHRLVATILLATLTQALYPTYIVQQYPGSWIENLAIRSNGMILATDITHARVYQINPFDLRDRRVLYQFPTQSVLGIVEAEPDIFYVTTANFSSIKLEGYGQQYIYRLTFNPDKVEKIAEVPEAGALDGLVYHNGRLLSSDLLKGVIWSITTVGEVTVAVNQSYTHAKGFQVDGLKVRDNQLYFTTPSARIFGRVTIDDVGRPTSGPKILTNEYLLDDFVLDRYGNAFVTSFTNGSNGVLFVPAHEGPTVLIANIDGPTAAAFGRTSADCHVLYVSATGGDFDFSPTDKFLGTGGILAVDLGEQYAGHCSSLLTV